MNENWGDEFCDEVRRLKMSKQIHINELHKRATQCDAVGQGYHADAFRRAAAHIQSLETSMRELAEKWREESSGYDPESIHIRATLRQCADELTALLAENSAPNLRRGGE